METKTSSKIIFSEPDYWQDAQEVWLSSFAANTQRAYKKWIQDLKKHSGSSLEYVMRRDLIRWISSLKLRKLSDASVAQAVAAAASFYRFCHTEYMVMSFDGEHPLAKYNPAAGKSLRPKIEKYGKSIYLSPAEAQRLLGSIPTRSLIGKMDRLMFSGYLLLARRNSEWRRAKLVDFFRSGNQIFYQWNGKGKTDQRVEVPSVIWKMVNDYVKAAGLGKPGDYIFRAWSLAARHLPNISNDWQAGKPLSGGEVCRRLKRYARLAGLDEEKITVHTLRHTGAMLRREAGEPLEDISKFLNHSNVAVTQVYVRSLEGRSDQTWQTVSRMLGLE
ncbi:MAG: tyrosine-type recombinase/integrase [Anaerolineaceae bacterium]|nr:tyrosine-type recombinase/integrase [Anaerolineaceae bacterium]